MAKSVSARRWPSVDLLSFISVFVALSAILSLMLPPSWLSLPATLSLELFILTIALVASDVVAAVFLRERDLPRLEQVGRTPSVALLFLVCDDLLLDPLRRQATQTYPHAEVFVLDDSSDPEMRRLIDQSHLRVIRRPDRAGYKAGSLNNWLRRYGHRFEYFVILDSDSILPECFVERVLGYAEHPANRDVAIFNSLPVCWNTASRFARVISAAAPVENWVRLRLANRLRSIFSAGHNNLHRTRAILEVGGFDEAFLSEDIAVTLKLVRAGYSSKLVNLVGFESEPETIFAYSSRLQRWAKQTVQILRADWRGAPLSLRFQLLRLSWMYASFALYPLWAALAAWGTTASTPEVRAVLGAALALDARALQALLPAVLVSLLPFLGLGVRIPLAFKLRVSIRRYLAQAVLSVSIALYNMLAVPWVQLLAATGAGLEFDVTSKRHRPVTLPAILYCHWHLLLFVLFLLVGFLRNPLALAFAAPWLLAVLLAPVLIFLAHDQRARAQPSAGAVTGPRGPA